MMAPATASSPYEVGVYYFPNYHADPRTSNWHGKGWTEWELMKVARPRFPGHQQPKVPAWGYEDESDPAVMARKSAVAAAHGLNHWIFDWYHYEGAPFLNGCLDRGFLGAGAAHTPMKFALMWANHDWVNIHPARASGKHPVMLNGRVSPEGFVSLVRHVIGDYFTQPHYWCIQGAPYFSIYDLGNFMAGLGGLAETCRALDVFRQEAARMGFPRIHLNLINWKNRLLEKDAELPVTPALVNQLGFDSVGSYAWVHHFRDYTFPETDYLRVLDRNAEHWAKETGEQSIPYFPNVSMGWDSSPRTIASDVYESRGYPAMPVFKNSTPANFKAALLRAKALVDEARFPVKHLSINAWNEWTEGSYLEPDTISGYEYLEAVRDVFAQQSAGHPLGHRSG
jgi:hypothetical protein